MSTSGSYDFSLTAAQLIARVAKDIGILSSGGTINVNDETDILQTLNVVAKELGISDLSFGIKPFLRQRVVLFLAKGQQTYTVGPAATDARATTAYGRTTISANEAAGQTVLSITSNTDTTTNPGTTVTMANGDIIGIELDSGTIDWTTISGTPGATATVAVALTGAAAAGNYVWWFTSRAQRFAGIEGAVVRDENYKDTEMTIYRDVRQYDLGVVDKQADSSSPVAMLVEPLRLNTRVTLDIQPTDVTKQIVMTVLYPNEDYDATSNDIALPQEYFGYLEWETALRSCPMFFRQWTPDMERNYQNAMSRAKNLNPEVSDLYFQSGT